MKSLEDPVTYFRKLNEELDALDGRIVHRGGTRTVHEGTHRQSAEALTRQVDETVARRMRRDGTITGVGT